MSHEIARRVRSSLLAGQLTGLVTSHPTASARFAVSEPCADGLLRHAQRQTEQRPHRAHHRGEGNQASIDRLSDRRSQSSFFASPEITHPRTEWFASTAFPSLPARESRACAGYGTWVITELCQVTPSVPGVDPWAMWSLCQMTTMAS